MEESYYMTVEEAAEYLRCSVGTICNNCKNRRMPFIKGPGRMRLFTRPMLDQWLDRRSRKVRKHVVSR